MESLFIEKAFSAYNKAHGFTLAEVLITLGVIGVVAAITLPAITQKIDKKVSVTQLKKNFTTLHEVIRLSEKDNGEVGEWTLPEGSNYDSNNSEFFKNYFEPYFKVIGKYGSLSLPQEQHSVYNIDGDRAINVGTWHVLPDGSSLGMFYNLSGGAGTDYTWIFIDINGKSGPNRLGRDIFMTELVRNKRLVMWGNSVAARGRNEVYNDSLYPCKKGTHIKYAGGYCGALIQADGWEIKDDYPW